MKKLLLLSAAAACALSAMACGPLAYRYRAGILTPNTPEGNACRRECLALIGSCVYYRRGDVQVTIEAGPYSARYGCPGVVSDCLSLCEGAIVDPDNPPRYVPVLRHWQVEEEEVEYAD